MRRLLQGKWKRIGLAVVALLATVAIAAWVERTPLLAWYYLHALAKADEASRDAWAERAAGLDTAVIPGLLRCLGCEDARTCANAQRALTLLAERWGWDDLRTSDLAEQLTRAFPRLSGAGQQSVLRLQTEWLRQNKSGQSLPASMTQTSVRLLAEAGRASGKETRGCALDLAALLLQQPNTAPSFAAARDLVRMCLQDAEPENRLRAVQLAAPAPRDLLKQVIPLLSDSTAEIRCAALRVLGPADREEIADEELLRSLHDTHEDVRRLCEATLRGNRAFSEEDLKLGRLLTDDRPAVRLQVLTYLERGDDLEPGVWLRRLSHDPSPAVRSAALRTAAEQTLVDLTDRIDQMAQRDPSPTIRDQAKHFLSQPKRRPLLRP